MLLAAALMQLDAWMFTQVDGRQMHRAYIEARAFTNAAGHNGVLQRRPST